MCRRYAVCLCLLMSAGLCGCNSSRSENAEIELPDWLNDSAGENGAEDQLFADDVPASLGLNLKVGDQFPLRKVVEQELTQEALQGVPTVNRSRLELMFAITVSDRQADRTKLVVRYDRVKYQHRVAEEEISYDSTQPPANVPLAVRAYHDMVGDGFSFWIGSDNQIAEVEGLKEFLERCLRNVPAEHRQDVVLGIEAGSGETGIANFVDNSIGLLPGSGKIQPGDSWEQQQAVMRPVPMHISNTYTLKETTNDLAVIDVRGTIAPSTGVRAVDNGEGVRVRINGGTTLGSCTIFRQTGLPQESRIDRMIEMTVTMPNAIEFQQRKRITTTIESFPAVAGSRPLMLSEQPPTVGENVPVSTAPRTGLR